jgi:hypothetical protein
MYAIPTEVRVQGDDYGPLEPPAPSTTDIDGDLTLPESYGMAVLRLLVQDPYHLFAYWEMPGSGPGRYLLLHSPGRPSRLIGPVGARGRWWFEADPGAEYSIEVVAGERIATATARTPRPGLSSTKPPARSGGRIGQRWDAAEQAAEAESRSLSVAAPESAFWRWTIAPGSSERHLGPEQPLHFLPAPISSPLFWPR